MRNAHWLPRHQHWYAVREAPLFGGLTCEVALQGQSALGILATEHLHCGAFPARQHRHLQMLLANLITQSRVYTDVSNLPPHQHLLDCQDIQHKRSCNAVHLHAPAVATAFACRYSDAAMPYNTACEHTWMHPH